MQKEPLKAAVCLGSTGAVGQKLIEELARNPNFGTILTLVRKPTQYKPDDVKSEKIIEHVIGDINRLDNEVQQAVRSNLPKHETLVGFSTLGIGKDTAYITIDQHRAVDVEMNSSFAKGLKETGKVQHLVFMSAAGANPSSWAGGPGAAGFPRYNRVKGEAEEAVKGSGIPHISIFRPGGIIGIPNTGVVGNTILPWFNFLLPAKVASVKVEDLARSMAVRGAQETSVITQEKEAVRIFHHPDMMELLSNV